MRIEKSSFPEPVDGVGLSYSISFNKSDAPPDFEGTMDALMDALELHYQKALDYDGMENEFGLKGEIIGLTRKMGKLKRIYWYGKDPLFEDGQELLMDLIGTTALMLRMQKKVNDRYRSKWRQSKTEDKPDFPQQSWGC
jgi:hypothetical protein